MITAGSIFALVLAAFQAVPVINTWLQQFVAWYVAAQLQSMRAEDAAAIKKAVQLKDQRDLEKQLGNPDAGGLTNQDGSEVRTSLPGVPHA